MNFFRIFCLVFSLAFALADDAVVIDDTRITNAPRAALGEFPWHALLAVQYYNDNRVAFWNGVILNDLWILATAASVTNARTIRADIGHVYINHPALRLFPDFYIIHPQYNVNRYINNIALVRMPLNQPIRFPQGPNPIFWPIRLPTLRQQHATFEGAEAYFSGWGFVRPNDRNISEFLSFSDQRVISNRACMAYYENDVLLISPNMVCSMSVNILQGACDGDGGAPLVINEFGTFTLIGTLSFLHRTANCGRQPAPAAFTRITSHFDWIARTTGYQFRP